MLAQLGNKVAIPESPTVAILEVVPVSSPAVREAVVRFSCPEFTSLCPVTGQPDFARFYIDYIPDKWLLESKSLKLFLCSFRNHGAFHEDVTTYIGTRIYEVVQPQWIRIAGIWYARGGISLDIYWQKGSPGSIYIPPIKINTYQGR